MPLAKSREGEEAAGGKFAPDIRKPGDLPACEKDVVGGRGVPRPAWAGYCPREVILPKGKGRLRVSVTLHVCITCRRGLPDAGDGPRAGAVLHEALLAAGAPEGVRILPVECLSACDHGCNIALSAPGRWSYVYGHMDPDTHVADILSGAAAYAKASDGIVPWRERPVIFRKQSLARIPPLEPVK